MTPPTIPHRTLTIRQMLFNGLQSMDRQENHKLRLDAVGGEVICDIISQGHPLIDHIKGENGILDILEVPIIRFTKWMMNQLPEIRSDFDMAMKFSNAAKKEKLLDESLQTLEEMRKIEVENLSNSENYSKENKDKLKSIERVIKSKKDIQYMRQQLMGHMNDVENAQGSSQSVNVNIGSGQQEPKAPVVHVKHSQAERLEKLKEKRDAD